MKRSILGGALLLAMGQAGAATINVTRFDDPLADGCGVNGCSLREAVGEANSLVGADAIVLQAGTYVVSALSAEGVVTIAVTDRLTVTGVGMTQTPIRATGPGSIFKVTAASATFRRLSIKDATSQSSQSRGGAIYAIGTDLLLDQVALSNNRAHTGGAAYLLASTLTLRYASLSGNVAVSGPGALALWSTPTTIYRSTLTSNSGGHGGAIDASDSPIRMQAASSINNNVAAYSGGAVLSNDEFVADDDCEVRDNTAGRGGAFSTRSGVGLAIRGVATANGSGLFRISGNRSIDGVHGGGAISVSSGPATLERVAIEGNSGRLGGGIYVFADSALTMTDSVVSNNQSPELGGGLINFGTADVARSSFEGNQAAAGGAIVAYNNAQTTLTNVDIYNNTAPSHAAIENRGTATLTHVTVSGNRAGTVIDAIHQNSTGSLIHRNSILDGRCSGSVGLIVAQGKNLRTPQPAGSCSGTSVSTLNLALRRGTYHGSFDISGTSSTTSPLIDAGDAGHCPRDDVRRALRDVKCDIGAFEYGAVAP